MKRYFTKRDCAEKYEEAARTDQWSAAALWMALWIEKRN